MAIQKKTPAAPAARAATPINKAKTASAAAQGQTFASLNPEDFTSGGLLDDVDVTFSSVRFCEWDYNGNIDHPVLALLVVMDYQDADGKAAQTDQYYSAGETSRFVPSEDGSHAVAVAGAKGLAGGTNAAILIKSVIDQGFPVDKFGDGDVSSMEGLVAHINRIAQPKRGGQITGKTSSGYEATVAVVTKIHKMPWESTGTGKGAPARPTSATQRLGASTARPAARPAPASIPSEAPAGDVGEEAAGVLIEILSEKQGTVAKRMLPPASFKKLAGNDNRSAILQCFGDDNWLMKNGENYGWSFDGQTITAA